MSIETNKSVISDLFEEVWGRGDISAAARFYAAGEGLNDLQAFATRLYATFPDWRSTIDELVGEGDTVVVRWTGRGTHTGAWSAVEPTNRVVTIEGIDVEHLVDGMIVEEHSNVDMLGFLQQIGELPG